MATQSTTGQPQHGRPVIEPSMVIRRREPRPLEDFAELFRQEAAAAAARQAEDGNQDDTQEMAPVREPEPAPPGAGRRAREWWDGRAPSARSTVAIAAASAVGCAVALLIALPLGGATPAGSAGAAAQVPSAAATPSASSAASAPEQAAPATSAPAAGSDAGAGTDPDGAGVLREGSSGAAVTDLQQRLLRIPNVYEGGQVNGVYDATLAAAVARFQVWYGIRGDESGVYGDDTRRDLESRTS